MTAKKVGFRTFDGSMLVGVLSYPAGRGKVPLVVLLHGWASDKSSSRNKLLTKLLTNHGIGTMAFDFRGHGESGGDINKVSVITEAQDITEALNFLATRRRADSKRLGIVGPSIGGSSALHMVANDPLERFRCAVLIAPRTDFAGVAEDMYYQSSKGRKIQNRVMLPVGRNIDFYADARSASLPPTLVIHGSKDEFISVEQSRKLAAQNKQIKLMEIQGGDHTMKAPKYLTRIADRAVKFLVEHLI